MPARGSLAEGPVPAPRMAQSTRSRIQPTSCIGPGFCPRILSRRGATSSSTLTGSTSPTIESPADSGYVRLLGCVGSGGTRAQGAPQETA